jgi:V/A-type H+-transporting ATPase subunit A
LISWSKYQSFIKPVQKERGHAILRKSHDVAQMMKVVGEEGTGLEDYVDYLKGEFFDFVYLQQNAFDPVDEATAQERQVYVFDFIYRILESDFAFAEKDEARRFFQQLRQLFKGWNSSAWESEDFKNSEEEIKQLLASKKKSE